MLSQYRFLILLACAAACGPVKGTPPVDVDAAIPGFSFAVRTANVSVPLDGRAAVELAITRTGGFTGTISVTPDSPPNGLVVEPLEIADGTEVAELVVGALSPFVIGDTVSFTIDATGDGVDPQTATITDAAITGAPGSLDATFGVVGTGYAQVSFGSDDDGLFNALEIIGGNIVASGTGTAGLGARRFRTIRLTGSGAIDTTFGNGALVTTGFGGGSASASEVFAVGHQFDGRLILIGHAPDSDAPTPDLAVARLSTTGGGGGIDFGNAGVSKIDLGGDEATTHGLVLEDNRIVFVGSKDGHHLLAVATSSGIIDPTFNATGFIREVIGAGSSAHKVTVDNSDRILVAGNADMAGEVDITLHRYTTAGVAVPFGAGNRIVVSAPGTAEVPVGLAVLPNNQILVASTAGAGVTGTRYQVRRFDDDGTLDTTFGTNGLAELEAPGNVTSFTLLPDGKLLLVGETSSSAVLVRFKANGAPDSLFGSAGVATIAFGDAASVRASIVFDPHKVVISGGNSGGMPGPGTFGVLARLWM